MTKYKTKFVKRPKPQDFGCPKLHANGYLLFRREQTNYVKSKIQSEEAQAEINFRRKGLSPAYVSHAKVMTIVAEMWKALSIEEREKYHATARVGRKEGEKEIKKWRTSESHKAYQEAKRLYEKRRKQREEAGALKKLQEGPRRPPRGGFFLFSSDKEKRLELDLKFNLQGMPSRDVARALGKVWQSMSSEEKQSYEDRAKKLQDEYELKKVEWVESLKVKEQNSTKTCIGLLGQEALSLGECMVQGGQQDGPSKKAKKMAGGRPKKNKAAAACADITGSSPSSPFKIKEECDKNFRVDERASDHFSCPPLPSSSSTCIPRKTKKDPLSSTRARVKKEWQSGTSTSGKWSDEESDGSGDDQDDDESSEDPSGSDEVSECDSLDEEGSSAEFDDTEEYSMSIPAGEAYSFGGGSSFDEPTSTSTPADEECVSSTTAAMYTQRRHRRKRARSATSSA